MKKKAWDGMSDFIKGKWKISWIEFRNIHVGSSGPAHMRIKKKMTPTATMPELAKLELVSTFLDVLRSICRTIGYVSCVPNGTSLSKTFLKYYVPQKVICN